MAGMINSLGKRSWPRIALGFGGLLALAGCHRADRDDNFSNLDLKTRQMLLAPAGGNLKAPAQQYAVTDPAATGGTGISAANAFNRPMPPQGQALAKGEANTTGYVPANMPNTTGVVQASVGAPTIPNNPATMQLQPRVQQAVATAPAPAPLPVAQAPVPATPPVTPVYAEAPTPITVVNTSPAPAPAPAEFTPPPAPTPSIIAPPPLPAATPTPGTLTTLPSPIEQPPAGLGPVPPGPLK
jgi:hypothetical protein